MKANSMKLVGIAVLCVTVAILSGCYEKRKVTPPDTFPVSGKIVSPTGKIPVGYTILLTPDDMEKTAGGIIQQDGSFKLQTKYMGVRCDGAAKGSYRVSLVAPLELGAQTTQLPQVVEVTEEIPNLEIQLPAR